MDDEKRELHAVVERLSVENRKLWTVAHGVSELADTWRDMRGTREPMIRMIDAARAIDEILVKGASILHPPREGGK